MEGRRTWLSSCTGNLAVANVAAASRRTQSRCSRPLPTRSFLSALEVVDHNHHRRRRHYRRHCTASCAAVGPAVAEAGQSDRAARYLVLRRGSPRPTLPGLCLPHRTAATHNVPTPPPGPREQKFKKWIKPIFWQLSLMPIFKKRSEIIRMNTTRKQLKIL